METVIPVLLSLQNYFSEWCVPNINTRINQALLQSRHSSNFSSGLHFFHDSHNYHNKYTHVYLMAQNLEADHLGKDQESPYGFTFMLAQTFKYPEFRI